MSDEVDALESDAFEEGADVRVGVAQDERTPSRGAEPRKVDEMDLHALRKRLHDRFPPTRGASETVDEDGGTARARDPIPDRYASDLARSLLEHDTRSFLRTLAAVNDWDG